jgi:adenylosuccinate synthase
MPATCVFGTGWGDEGKGGIVDLLTEKADVVVRTGGGANAGHTVVIGEETFKMHLVPCGILHKGKHCVIANGVVLDPGVLIEEIDTLEQKGYRVRKYLHISDRAHIVLPFHKKFDELNERIRGGKKIGTTRRGIGPTYADKMARIGIRAGDFLEETMLLERIKENVKFKNPIFKAFGEKAFSAKRLFEEYRGYAEKIRGYIEDTSLLLDRWLRAGKKVLFEGAHGNLLDIDHGTYPFVTSSNCTVLGVPAQAGISPKWITNVIGVVKAYMSRVGEGPFPTELQDSVGERIRERGREYGTTTGRPRRCGWFDGVAVKYAVRINGIDSVALTLLDVLSGFDEIKICTTYKHKGKKYTEFPGSLDVVEHCSPVYEVLPGWKEEISQVRRYRDLPQNAKRYLRFISRFIKAPIGYVSVGPERTQIVKMAKT